MTVIQAEARGDGKRFCLVVSRFNREITRELEAGAIRALTERGVAEQDIDVIRVPGAWELPQAVRLAVRRGRYDGIIALGCVIRGETPHFEYVALGATVGLQRAAADLEVPIAFGVLTTDDGEQARRRAGGSKGNKGEEAALAALELCGLAERLG